jgi:NAD+ synthase (glutamine-hydrolysing)
MPSFKGTWRTTKAFKPWWQMGFDRSDVEKVTRLIKLNEYKRRQSPVGIRVTHRSFGKDWRYPITNRFRA